ncbi:MAG: hypothetical protein IPM74_02435 [Crocinitomicaceae bacterium]|nr:hypothetical protein [Crocinitomicaceae bacterium]MBK8924774.1 hypothetical protein [Crocinitomicaceae bacterium]
MHQHRCIIVMVTVISLVFVSCRKEEPTEIELNTAYHANFRGMETNYPHDSINHLNIEYILTNLECDSLVFDGSSVLEISNDTVYGELKIPSMDYLIDPYLIATFEQQSKGIIIRGKYSALKDSSSAIAGEIIIQPK